jgi:DNA helicase II / ATP-dependent DNA helicase PcrA
MTDPKYLTELNKEKQNIIKTDGNILVIANPGTGKTKLLVCKYLYMIQHQGFNPEDILCLTFTNKAKRELEERILEGIKENNIKVDYSKLNIHTFHSYALDALNEEKIVSSNLLRYSIYKFLKENETLNYSDNYLLDTIVPKMENLLRYLKSFGITPDKVNVKEIQSKLEGDEKVSKEELDKFAEDFLEIYKHYETIKDKFGLDYADILIKFSELKNSKKFKYVLVDELQDVNRIEAEIALNSGDNFIAVGDKKQAIFGFQGGSIYNFELFQDSNQFVLTENFRSANPILDYSKYQFLEKTKEEGYKEELRELKNNIHEGKEIVKICNVDRDNVYATASELAHELSEKGGKTAIIVRTNNQITKVSQELKKRKMEHSSTFVSASGDTKKNIVKFLKGILSNDPNDIKNSMFTPYFPISMQDAFSLTENKELTLEDIYSKSPEFRKIRNETRNLEDLKKLFASRIIPISIAYGREYMVASMSILDNYLEAFENVEEISLKNLLDYIQSSNLLSSESTIEKEIVITTVHKSKGREYDNVIYLPWKSKNNSNFQDDVANKILISNGIDASEEIEEESLRIDFVAFTRAKEKLFILTDKIEDYLDDHSEIYDIGIEGIEDQDLFEKGKRAYGFFLEKEFEKAEKLLESKNKWIKEYVKEHFESMDRISFSSLQTNAFEYLINNILKLREFSFAANIGTDVHILAEELANGNEIEIREELKPFKENIVKTLNEVKKNYPELVETEKQLNVPISKMIYSKSELNFKGFIDLILKNDKDEYLILDWKTDKKKDKASKHKQQLEAYKAAYAVELDIPLDKIQIAIAFIGLRETINLGNINYELEDKKPTKRSFGTFEKKVKKIIDWKENPEMFWGELTSKNSEDLIWQGVVDQYKSEC